MQETRKRILQTLLARRRCTINELAEAVGITPISVRHHIGKLEAAGVVASEEERHGVGRPRRLYYLTEAGLEKFPSQYVRLTSQLLRQLKASLPAPMVSKLFAEMARNMAKEFTTEVESRQMNTEERLEFVTSLLNREGFMVTWENSGDHYVVQESVCPYYHVGQDHPEVCVLDKTFIATLLDVPPEKIQQERCIFNGDKQCRFVIPKTSAGE